jgi:deazaflavin-dependent oxidoreductase (nitroreductase family)
MSTATPSAPARRRTNPILGLSRLFNPVAMRLAGTPLLPLYGVIQHVGRRSRKVYRTPVVVRPTRDGFVVPMPWGEGTDWYRNVRAAGECVIRWRGREFVLSDPQVIDATSAAGLVDFNSIQRAGMRRFGIKQCLRLRFKN